jgi:hypothetical protein
VEVCVDYSQLKDDVLLVELEAMRLALGAPLGHPFDGREERNKVTLGAKIEAAEAELAKRNAPRS